MLNIYQPKLTALASVLFITFALASCNKNKTAQEEVHAADTTGHEQEETVMAQSVFYSVPSPIETASLLQKAGAKYDPSILNPPANVSKYNSTGSKALNLGVYGSDLSFASIFDQTQQSLFYLKATNKLATDLGISGAFDDKTLTRVQNNMSNKDSIISIVSDAYWAADAYLEENNRPNTSALIIAGGWIEGLYIACRISEKTENKEIKARIAEQKLSLENLIKLLESGKADDDTTPVLEDLKSLSELYNTVKIESSEGSSTSKGEVTTISGGSKLNASDDQLKSISEKIKSIRTSIIK